ncbi:MAG: hypothetical protein ACOYOU_03100 [Kiritimatiellia bacterium]
MERRKRHKSTIRSVVLTLRLTEEEMLRFKVAALSLGKRRARLVRERVADLIGMALPGVAAPTGTAPTGTAAKDETVINCKPVAECPARAAGTAAGVRVGSVG